MFALPAKTNKNRIKPAKGDRLFDTVVTLILIIVLLIALYPLYFTVIASLSDAYSVVKGRVFLWPVGFNLKSYQNVLKETSIWTGYLNSIKYTVFGTLFNLALTIPAAYVMSKKRMLGYRIFSTVFLVCMYFSGGLIPTYLQIKGLGLLNKSYTLIFLGGFSIYNMIITRVYFENSIPGELYESAYIDGANEFVSFFNIGLPLSKAIVAVIALYYAVGHWNGFFNALIYLSKAEYYPLQLVLRNILLLNQGALSMIGDMDAEEIAFASEAAYRAETMKYALIFISSAPLLAAYPFVQKYFVKGVMIGSVKG